MKRVLFVGQVHSMHFQRMHAIVLEWFAKHGVVIESVLVCGWPVLALAFPWDSELYDYANYGFRAPVRVADWERKLFLDGRNNLPACVRHLKRVLSSKNVDMIWIHDLQAGGYLLLDALDRSHPLPPMVASLYGNDLYLFSDHAEHRAQLERLLPHVSILQTETRRDQRIAEQLGFSGTFATISSATLAAYEEQEPQNHVGRDIFLLVKGSYRWRSNLMALYDLIDRNPAYFSERPVVVFGASPEDQFHCKRLAGRHRLNVLGSPSMPIAELFRLMSRSHFHLSLTLSDGVANTCAEAAIRGCLPLVTRHNGFAELLDKKTRQLLVLDHEPDETLLIRLNHMGHGTTEHQRVLRLVRQAVRQYFSLDARERVLRSAAALMGVDA